MKDNAIARVARFVKPYWKEALTAPILMLVEVAMDLAQPRLLERIVDEGIAQMDLDIVLHSGILMVVFALIGAIGGVGCTAFSARVAHRTGADIRSELFARIQSFSFRNIDRFNTGKLVTRLTNDVVQIQELIILILRMLIRSPFMLIGSIIMAFATSPRLSIVFLAVIPIIAVVLFIMVRRGESAFTNVQDRLDTVNAVVQENLAGVRVVKAFVRSDHEERRFDDANTTFANATVRATRLMAINGPITMFVLNLGIVAVLWFGGVGVSTGNTTVGEILAVSNYLLRSLFSVMMVGMLIIRIARALASAHRINEILTEEPVIGPSSDALRPTPLSGAVTFDRVSFTYEGAPVLSDISFQIDPGETVAIFGTTGSGKSTLVQLIPRYYDVASGSVLIDGIDVRKIDPAFLRQRVVVSLQNTVLFSGTIEENIRYGREEATEKEIASAATAAQVTEFVDRLPGGYETTVGQRGVGLSGGQKQRVAIARALVSRPAVLILDDCTSAVDVATEVKIHASLKEREQITTIIVAQRISTVLNADRILLLEEGRLAAAGTHRELLESNAIYREIYETQLGRE